jgi:hypothetical protein
MSGGYTTLAFVLPEATTNMARLTHRLRRRYADAAVSLRRSTITMRWGEWGLRISENTSELALEECREMAASEPDDPTWRRVARAVGRLELWTDPDPEDRYDNQWLTVSEHLGALPGALAYEPMFREWLSYGGPRANSERDI